jgi:hypothetical protein
MRILLGVLVSASVCCADVIYVDDDATGWGDGSSWAQAWPDLSEALSEAKPGDVICVAQGCYRPGLPGGNRANSFVFDRPITVMGGYAGLGAPNPDERNAQTYRTILSGDLNNNDAEVADANQLGDDPTRVENSWHVVTVGPGAEQGILDGVTISGGNANGDSLATQYGGGVYGGMYGPYDNGRLTLRHCIIEGNSAKYSGGGLIFNGNLFGCIVRKNYAQNGGGAAVRGRVEGCVFEDNYASGYGGGIEVQQGPHILNCTIRNNRALRGGGLYACYDAPIVERCIFTGNHAAAEGGAVYSYDCDTCTGNPELYSCLFVGNTCDGDGGAIFEGGVPEIQVVNCTIAHNTAGGTCGGVYISGTYHHYWAVANCIIWGNNDNDSWNPLAKQIFPTYTQALTGQQQYLGGFYTSCIEGWSADPLGKDNIKDDPLFIDADGADNIAGNTDDDLHLMPGSPCINKGDIEFYTPWLPSGTGIGMGEPNIPYLDLDGNPRLIGGMIDMGAYERPSSGPRTLLVPAAYATIQAAIDAAANGDIVLIADGLYTGDGNRDIDFGGKAITVRSEKGPDGCIIDCAGSQGSFRRGFYFHCEEGPDSILDGLTIKNGYAYSGGGVYCDGSASPTLTNCIIKANTAEHEGGGLYNYSGSGTLRDCTFISNSAGQDGGGMQNDEGGPHLVGCVFMANVAGDEGGGLCNEDSNPSPRGAMLTNCVFAGNSSNDGGGISSDRSSPVLVNCTFTRNHADYGGAIDSKAGASSIVVNCVLWANEPDGIRDKDAVTIVTYSDVQGGRDGEGNVDIDPLFADSESGDYHLKSQAGRWDKLAAGWVCDDTTSPCIDAGSMADPVGLEPFPNGGIVNMGAYGGTAQASKSYFGKPPCTTIVAGDINGDCIVDLLDLSFLTIHWLEDNNR